MAKQSLDDQIRLVNLYYYRYGLILLFYMQLSCNLLIFSEKLACARERMRIYSDQVATLSGGGEDEIAVH